jgi:hypothetical protein
VFVFHRVDLYRFSCIREIQLDGCTMENLSSILKINNILLEFIKSDTPHLTTQFYYDELNLI